MSKIDTFEIPQGLLEIARKNHLPNFTQHHIVQYCSIAFEVYAFPYHRQHKLVPHCSYFHYLELEERFGRGNFIRLNNQLNWLQNVELPNGQSHLWNCSNGAGATKAYELTRFGYDAIRIAMTDGKSPLATRKFLSKGNSIRSRDHAGSNSVGGFQMSPNIPIKITLIKEAVRDVSLLRSDESARGTPLLNYLKHSYCDLAREDYVKKLGNHQDMLTDILRIIKSSNLGQKGYLPQYYVQSSTGRWYCRGPLISLQNMPRQLRQVILQDYYDYDIESCHYSLFAQMTSKLHFKTPVIDQLISDKHAFRLELSKSLDIPIKEVKQALISLIYGSPLSSSLFCSLGTNLGKETAEAFCKLTKIRLLHREIKEGSTLIIEDYKDKSRRKGSLINDLGRSCVISQSPKASQLSHILQGAEAQILSSIGQRWGSSMVLLMHDGFVTKKQLNTDVLHHHVLKETGWNVQFSEELVSISKCTKN